MHVFSLSSCLEIFTSCGVCISNTVCPVVEQLFINMHPRHKLSDITKEVDITVHDRKNNHIAPSLCA